MNRYLSVYGNPADAVRCCAYSIAPALPIWNNEKAFICSAFAMAISAQSEPAKLPAISTAELKLLLRLLGQPGYSAPLALLKPSPKTPQRQLMAIAQSLQAKGWVDYRSQIERFALTQRGRSLFHVEMAARPVTPDEWRIVQACRKGPIDMEQISSKVPQQSRQDLVGNLEQGGFVKVMRRSAADIQLTQAGKDFLRRYRPSGGQAVLSLDLLTNYLNFMAEAAVGAREVSE